MVAARLTLDPTGNWAGYVQKTSGSTQLNHWITPAHDRAGNMTTVPKPASLANGLTLKYDAWNRLVEVKSGATTLAKHRYDGLRRRIDRATFPPFGFQHNHTYYNASWQILEIRQVVGETEHPESLQPKYQYVWSARYIDAPVLQDYNTDQDGLCDDGRYYYLGDANFNVTTLLDTSGDALEHYVYDPYGQVTAYEGDWSAVQPGFPYGFRFGYTGRERDSHTGVYHYRNRYYHAELGRFLTRDPIGYDGGDPNLYRYVFNNPVVSSDPLGLQVPGGNPYGTEFGHLPGGPFPRLWGDRPPAPRVPAATNPDRLAWIPTEPFPPNEDSPDLAWCLGFCRLCRAPRVGFSVNL